MINNEHIEKINLFYLEKAIVIEKLFFKNIVYLSLASIIASLLFLEAISTKLEQIDFLCTLFFSWAFFFLAILFAAIMTFLSATFKDNMFDASFEQLNKTKDNETDYFNKGRKNPLANWVYIIAIFAAFMIIIGFALLLIFMGFTISEIFSSNISEGT